MFRRASYHVHSTAYDEFAPCLRAIFDVCICTVLEKKVCLQRVWALPCVVYTDFFPVIVCNREYVSTSTHLHGKKVCATLFPSLLSAFCFSYPQKQTLPCPPYHV